MKNALLAELFCGQGKARLLSALFLADRDFSPKEFSIATGLDRGGVSRWLSRWSQIGLAERHASGRGVTYRASADRTLDGLRAVFLQYSELAQDILGAVEAMLPDAVSIAFDPHTASSGNRTDRAGPLPLIVVRSSGHPAGADVLDALRSVGERHGRALDVRVLSSADFADLRFGPGDPGLVVKPIGTNRATPVASPAAGSRPPDLTSVYR